MAFRTPSDARHVRSLSSYPTRSPRWVPSLSIFVARNALSVWRSSGQKGKTTQNREAKHFKSFYWHQPSTDVLRIADFRRGWHRHFLMTFAQAPITLGKELGMEEEMRDDDGRRSFILECSNNEQQLKREMDDRRRGGQLETTPSFASGFTSVLRPIRHVLRVVFNRARGRRSVFRPESPISDKLRSRSPSVSSIFDGAAPD